MKESKIKKIISILNKSTCNHTKLSLHDDEIIINQSDGYRLGFVETFQDGQALFIACSVAINTDEMKEILSIVNHFKHKIY